MRILIAGLVLLALLLAGLNTPAGFRLLQTAAGQAGVGIAGLGGRFPDRLHAARVTMADAQGTWLEIDDLDLDWAPTALLRGQFHAGRITARALTVTRWPQSDGAGGTSGGFSLPDAAVERLRIDQVTLPEASLALAGHGRIGPNLLDAAFTIGHPTGFGVSADRIDLGVTGRPASARVTAKLAGLRLPGDRPDLLGPDPITLDATIGPELTLELRSAVAGLHVHGPMPGATIAADWHLHLPNLGVFAPDLAGSADLAGSISGSLASLTAATTIDATLAHGKLAGTVTLRGLPDAPVAAVSLHGTWDGVDGRLEAGAVRDAAGLVHVVVSDADVAGVRLQALFTIDPKLGWPAGTATLSTDRLPAPATGGRVQAQVTLDAAHQVTVTAEAHSLAIAGVTLPRASLTAACTGLLGNPTCRGRLIASDLQAYGVAETLTLDLAGTPASLGLRLAGSGTADLRAAATLNATARTLNLTALQLDARGQTVRLAGPARFDFATGLAVDRLRLALDQAMLDLSGRLSPALDLTATLRHAPLDLVRLIDPSLQANGTVEAEASLRGSLAAPRGSLHLTGSGLQLRSAGNMPSATLAATATLDGTRAGIDAQLQAGATRLTISGSAPLGAGAYDLRVAGNATLALLDPYLAPRGQQARGTVTLDGTLTGSAPVPSGRVTLHAGSFTDAAQGVRLTDINATLTADAGHVVLQSLTARAGGPITARGTLDLAGDRPLDATLTARGITPWTTDLFTAKLSADLSVQGSLATGLATSGTVSLERADIRIPERLPANLPSLSFRRLTPPAPTPPAFAMALDIALSTPGQIFVRGRGIDAELAGRLHLGGTVQSPLPDGGFQLVRGQLSLAGQALNFTSGKVAFDGHLPIDPTLDFIAKAQGTGVVATLAITGTASAPRIALSSVPERPQDEVLAQLLFNRSAASLSPLQIAQIAAGLAQITDVGGASSFDPLGRVRQGLGLDVLSVGGGTGSTSTLEAGRNLGHGVYGGVKQSVGGVGTQATVRLDLARGLRLEADIGAAPPPPSVVTQGAAPTGNQVGVTYEYEY